MSKPEPILFCDASSGVYIPQRFAVEIKREFVKNVTDEQYDSLMAGPSSDWYWDTWEDVLRSAIIQMDGEEFYLFQDGDLWVLPEGYSGPITRED